MNKSKGNMYPWVTHTWSPIIGCPHECSYCYTRYDYATGKNKPLPNLKLLPERLNETLQFSQARTIFVGHQTDMFAEFIDGDWILKILKRCSGGLQFDQEWMRNNAYVFQTKNPFRYIQFNQYYPDRCYFGTTIESNRGSLLRDYSKAPTPQSRACGFNLFRNIVNGLVEAPNGRIVTGLKEVKWFVTIEPVFDFDVPDLFQLIKICEPDFINIGADSKHHELPEPSYEKVQQLINVIKAQLPNAEIKIKSNLERLRRK